MCPKRFMSLWYVWRKPCTFLAPILTLSPNGPKLDSTWPMSPRSSIGLCPKHFLSLSYAQCKPCTYLASRQALSPNGPKWASTWASSPRSTIGCVWNDIWACGTFCANRSPILHRHWHCLQTDQNKIPRDPCHLGVQWHASKMFSEPMVHSAQTMQLSCV